MKNENIKTKISLFIFLPFLAVAIFCFGKNCLAEDNHLLISEVAVGITSSSNEFIELYNPSDSPINLKSKEIKLKLVDSSGRATSKQISWIKEIIGPKDYFLFGTGAVEVFFDAAYSSASLTGIGGVILTDKDGNIIDKLSWGEKPPLLKNPPILSAGTKGFEINQSGGLKTDQSIERKTNNHPENNNLDFVLQSNPSPRNSHYITPPPPPPPVAKDYAGKLKINEIFPAPKTKNDGKEFVEIKNLSDEKIDLSGMWIEDEKNHKVLFPNEKVESKKLFVLEGNFELNNTSPDTAFFVAKDSTKENPIDSVRYEKPKYDYAYAWNGSAWQWTSKDTKGAENQFDELLSGQIKKDKTIYAGVYANFEVKADDGAQHFTWNFGDDHKSYLKKTRHKYEKSGAYAASLKITGDGEDNLLSFSVVVEKFGKTKVQIVSLSPNPKGIDSKNEWLELFNGTKKKINLKGWSVATGWKNLYNHPITKNFILKANETKKLTRDFCAFALENKQAKIELRYPNGKVADKLKYDHENSISEDELYQKEGGAWQWILSQKGAEEKQNDTENNSQNATEINSQNGTEEKQSDTEGLEKADFDLSDLGKFSENPAWYTKQKNQIVLLFAKSNINPEKFLIKNNGQVLGISTTKFISKNTPTPKSSNYFWKKINAKLNQLILMF